MDIVIFGNGNFASLIWHELTFDSPHRVVAFTVDAEYIAGTEKHGLPVTRFDEVARRFPPPQAAMLMAMSGIDNSRARTARLAAARAMGYRPASWIASHAIVANDLRAGEHCIISDATTVQPFCAFGDNVIIRNGCRVSHHVTIGDNCFLAPAAVVCGGASIGENCTLGANCTVIDGVSIAPGCTVGAGAVVTGPLTEPGTYVGTPARLVRRTEKG